LKQIRRAVGWKIMQRIVNPELAENRSMSNRHAVLDVNTGESWIGRVLVLGVSVLLCLTLAFAAFDYVVPKVPDGAHGSTRRVGWYLHSGQWQADVRTLAAAFKFIVNSDSDAPIQTNSPTHQLAVPAKPVGPTAPDA